MPLQFVTVKMLPFDNKSEFQVVIDMPEGTALEQTARVAGELASDALRILTSPMSRAMSALRRRTTSMGSCGTTSSDGLRIWRTCR